MAHTVPKNSAGHRPCNGRVFEKSWQFNDMFVGSHGSGTGRTGKCREPVPRKARSDQVGTRPRNVQYGTSNGVATTFLFRYSPRKKRVLAQGPWETPIFSEGIGRGAEEIRRVRKAPRRSRKRREKCGRHSEVSEAKRKRKAVKKSGRGHFGRARVGRLGARMRRVRSGSGRTKKVSLLYPQTKGQA